MLARAFLFFVTCRKQDDLAGLAPDLTAEGESRLSPLSIALGLTHPDCNGAAKLATASGTRALLTKTSSCSSLG
jgi:hypothetical protein